MNAPSKTVLFASMVSYCLIGAAFAQNRPQLRQNPVVPQQEILFLTEEQESAVLDYMKEVRPDQVEGLLKLKVTRPNQYRRLLSRVFREMRYLEDVKKRDPERYEILSREKRLENDSRELARKYRETDDEAEKERIKKEMLDLLDQIFDLRQANREFEIERLEKRLAEAKENNRKRLENKDQIIEQRLAELLGARAWDW